MKLRFLVWRKLGANNTSVERKIMFGKLKKNGRSGHDISARLNSMRSDLDALHEDTRGLLNDIGYAAGYQVHGAMRNATGRVEEWGNEGLEGVRKTVRNRPLYACAISAGAGALLATLFGRV
jgi:ElaB/YqjD/DUF883 family membrane-anchored ribosome-binding protein